MRLVEQRKAQGGKVFVEINKDVTRTFTGHKKFSQRESGTDTEGLRDLRCVLEAYAVCDEQVGYSQGLSHMAAIFLMYMPPEDAFWCLMAMLNRQDKHFSPLRNMFLPGVELYKKRIEVFSMLVRVHLPAIAERLESQGVACFMFSQVCFFN
jgi:hypothetical protein